jgi:hypothetical protein
MSSTRRLFPDRSARMRIEASASMKTVPFHFLHPDAAAPEAAHHAG